MMSAVSRGHWWLSPLAKMKNSTAQSDGLSSWIKWILAVLALTVVIALGVSTVYRAAFARIERTDFTVYRAAGRAVLEGADIYQAHNSRGWAYVYPPPFAIVMAPFAKMSVFWGALIWYIISISMIAWAIAMAADLAGRAAASERGRWLLYAIPILLIAGWFVSAVTRGQASVILTWLVIAAFYWHFRERDVVGGLCLAGAILLKVFPALLLAYFVWRRRWQFTTVTLFSVAAGSLLLPATVFGWQRNITYLHEWTAAVAKPGLSDEATREQSYLNEQLLDPQKPRNQSLMAVIWRLTRSGRAREIAAVLVVLMALATAWVARRPRDDMELLVASAAIAWVLLVPPVSESHYFVMLLLPLAVLTGEALGQATPVTRRIACSALIVFGVVSIVAVSLEAAKLYGFLCWATAGLWAALVTLTARRTVSP
jgi:Glycosyltransferase family 87